MKPVHQHGGQLRLASEKYGIPLPEWLDLSTGISPFVYPLPEVPLSCWQRLPETGDGLEAAAASYYGSDYLLPVSGSQEAIQRLPLLRTQSRVGIISPAYHSHQQAWVNAGHQVSGLVTANIDEKLAELDVLLLVNPNNPNTEYFSREQLLHWHQQLASRGGWLVVDEAYMDCQPDGGLIQPQPLAGLIVLRSVGKFFGLAGIRLGFVWADAELLQALVALQDDWSVSHPARWAGRLALADAYWQQQQRERLIHSGQRLKDMVQAAYPDALVKATALFVYCRLPTARMEFERLASAGVLLRYFAEPAALRFGLPETEADWARLAGLIGVNQYAG
ncbi:MAG: threonine-phosphate decarboxylase CobD [Thiolinea sp.]